MTPKLYSSLIHIMDEVIARPLSKIFLDFREAPESERHRELHEIYGKVLTQEYQTLEEWRADIRSLSKNCLYSLTARAAQEICKFCEKQYQQLISMTSFSDWAERYTGCLQKVQTLLDETPTEYHALGEMNALLHSYRDQLPLNPSLIRRSQSHPQKAESSSHLRSFVPLEPVWLPAESSSSSSEDNNEEFIAKRPHRSLSGGKAAMTPPEARTPPEGSQMPSIGRKVPRQLKANHWKVPEKDIRDLVTALPKMDREDEKNTLCFIIAQMEPEMEIDSPVITVDVAELKMETVRALIDFVQERFRKRKMTYPDG